MNGTELCASVFVVGFVSDLLRLYISISCKTLKNKSNETLTVKHSFLEKNFKFDQNLKKSFSDGFYKTQMRKCQLIATN